jgi:hypothetical protein
MYFKNRKNFIPGGLFGLCMELKFIKQDDLKQPFYDLNLGKFQIRLNTQRQNTMAMIKKNQSLSDK